MRKKGKVLSLSIFAIFIVSFLNYRLQIPDIQIEYFNFNVRVVKYPLRWGIFFPADIEWKRYSPPELLKNIYAIPVYPESTLHFSFDKDPEHYDIYLWDGKMNKYVPTGNSPTVVVPSKGGAYIFIIQGYWSQGEVQYIFWVDVMS